MITIPGKYTTAEVMIDDVESEAVSQIHHFVNHPAFTNPVRIMPDVHAGKGSVVGFTMELPDKIIPNVVGVDIGCGMLAVNIGKNLDMSLPELDVRIRAKVPFGQNTHEESALNMEREFPWKEVQTLAEKFRVAYQGKFGTVFDPPRYNMDWFLEKVEQIGGHTRYFINSVGSLGGGNHFVEIGLAGNGDYWVTVHSGSRNFGKRICEYWQGRAVKFWRKDRRVELAQEIERIKKEEKDGHEIYRKIKAIKKEMKLDVGIDMKGCEWLEGQLSNGYLYDMLFAQKYAEVNRQYIMDFILKILKAEPQESVISVHNFIDFEDFIIRKGAIRAYEGERCIIPFNMRDGLLICEGKSNPDWNYSAPHGAGRIMSRGGAKSALKVEDFQKQMEGIYSTSIGFSTLDEAPGAYKDASLIEAAIEPTVTIVEKVKPILNMKDGGGPPPWKVEKLKKKGLM